MVHPYDVPEQQQTVADVTGEWRESFKDVLAYPGRGHVANANLIGRMTQDPSLAGFSLDAHAVQPHGMQDYSMSQVPMTSAGEMLDDRWTALMNSDLMQREPARYQHQ